MGVSFQPSNHAGTNIRESVIRGSPDEQSQLTKPNKCHVGGEHLPTNPNGSIKR